jgi:glycosyltransferase involved in cell wall biosynthesis
MRLWRSGATLYHSPSFSSLAAAPCPWIVTIHDLNHLTYGGPLERAYYETLLRKFAQKAKKVLTVSDFSRGEIERWDRKLRPEVVSNAIDPAFLKAAAGVDGDGREALARRGLEPGKYFICLSSDKPHKNVSTLVRAFEAFRTGSGEGREFKLATSSARYESEPGVVSVGGISDAEAIALVREARAVVFPSVYEGFGLPPVEGAALGTPLIVSDIPAHREALRDLKPSEVRWIEPLSEDAWTQALRRSAAASRASQAPSEDSRRKLAERYSVERLGESMDRIYRHVLGIEKTGD